MNYSYFTLIDTGNSSFGTPPPNTVPKSINDLGQIVGSTFPTAFVYSGGTFNFVIQSGIYPTAESINNFGQIAGYYEKAYGGMSYLRATIVDGHYNRVATLVPNGSVRWSAVKVPGFNRSPRAVLLPLSTE
jgi:hypothetical protein